jgi:deoxyribonucleoside regulator
MEDSGSMSGYTRGDERNRLLANVAEMYYDEGLTQSEIAKTVGVTRSAVSRMLSEARQKGIVTIQIQRSLRFDEELAACLEERFGLLKARVVVWDKSDRYHGLRSQLGMAASHILTDMLKPNTRIGIAWGTTVSATIEAFTVASPLPATVVQLVGVAGSTDHTYNVHAQVQKLAEKLQGKGVYLFTPFVADTKDMARALLNNQSIREVIEVAKSCDIALLGIGTTAPDLCSLYLAGHISLEVLKTLQAAGAVGDIGGWYFDADGKVLDLDLHKYLVGISAHDLLNIPLRLAVAGSVAKVEAIRGALQGRLINVLVTDNQTAELVLEHGG